MPARVLSFKPAVGLYGRHDPSAVLFEDGTVVFGVEEERLSRQKHAPNTFPERAIRACLAHENLALADVDRVVLPYDPALRSKLLPHYLRDGLGVAGVSRKLRAVSRTLAAEAQARFAPTRMIEARLAEIGTPVPPIETRSHHACHAASAFHPSGFDDALVLTVDAKGEYDSTVVWRGDERGLTRIRTYRHPNSLGLFYAVVTEYLGYRMFNGEGKVMGLAPYGGPNDEIAQALDDVITGGVDYDVSALTKRWGTGYGVAKLEDLLGRPRTDAPGEFDRWEKDLAFFAQRFLEETVVDVVETYARRLGTENVALAGGVALNCKLNERIRESPSVGEVFVQPAANDAGLAIGAGLLDRPPREVPTLRHVYLGPSSDDDAIASLLETNKLSAFRPRDVERYVAERLAAGRLVGWFHGRQEFGPRALGGRSILADPRTADSRERVNRRVKHREPWRPFAPSMLEEAVEEYLVDGESSPFMTRTFDVRPEKRDDLAAVIHPADGTTRPQTVTADQNPRFHRLIAAFEALTGVPAVLNTSFNDSGEPIVTTPTQAIKDFYGMGLDVLVLEECVIEKRDAGRPPIRVDQRDSEPTRSTRGTVCAPEERKSRGQSTEPL